MLLTLKDRISNYEDISGSKLLPKLPVIITINGRAFKKLTSLMKKPYCETLTKSFCEVMIKLASNVDGAAFLYSFNDEIVIVSRNDQALETEPWYKNDIASIASVCSSIASLSLQSSLNDSGLNVVGEPIFLTKVFAVPSVTEAINVLICKQQQAYASSVSAACFYELLKKYSYNEVIKITDNATTDQKIDILLERCAIDYNQYPISFRKGVACYRKPKVVYNNFGEEEIKQKLAIDIDLPTFTQNTSFLKTILASGQDIIRI